MIYYFKVLFIALTFIKFPQYNMITTQQNEDGKYTYNVKLSTQSPDIDSDWKKMFWKDAKAVSLKNYMGEKPLHFPDTQVKMKYDRNNVYIVFQVKDRYVRAIAKETNGRVWEDSCVEFFFTPGPDVNRGYFNLETNCKGIFLLQFHNNTGKKQGFVNLEDTREIEISHSLETNAENEITKPLTWTVEYRIPLSILSKYMEVDKPEPGARWRANFYKCGDKTSHPHWLTWAPVDRPKPNFHLPEFFGWLAFE